MYEFIGALAACLTTISFMPQLFKIIRSRDTTSISFYMYLTFVSGVACWLIYGFYLESLQIIIANAITLILSGIILALKARDVFLKDKK
ncbi:MAG: SemiSWEET transporter [Rickettsiales bacterium]|jgi:MtN3 and saliva related transmembrane protein|nr:SemiSWEET transporter [Rickettsiales bacterium]